MTNLLIAMEQCMQTSTQSVIAHGRSVVEHFDQMMDHLEHGTELPSWWRLPSWIYTPGLLKRLPSRDILREYMEFHDCGKPYCCVIDDMGRKHYPDHAAVSERVWLAVGGHSHAARLIGQDMDAHLLKADGVELFSQKEDAVTLLMTAVAETHSNAAMFGGVDSDSFKIKCKNLDKRGKAVISLLFPPSTLKI